MLCDYGCGGDALNTLKNGRACCKPSSNSCPAIKAKNAAGLAKAHAEGRMRTDQFDGKRNWNKGKTFYSDARLMGVSGGFSDFSSMTTAQAKKVILQENLLPYCCSRCGLDNWQGEAIVLELDHINGIRRDNRLENLRFLCPNCHSLTPTFKGRNCGNGHIKVDDETLMEALRTTPSIRQALIKVGMDPKGGNYARANRLKSQLSG